MHILFLTFLCGFIYWLGYQFMNIKLNKYTAGFFKWLSVVGFTWYTGWSMESLILICYSLGDVVIIWHQTSCLGFFLMGHLVFITTMLVEHNFTFVTLSLSIAITVYYGLLKHASSINETTPRIEKILYFTYIWALGYTLVASLWHTYIGYILFVVSDLSIGFKFKYLKLAEFPLYWFSLLYMIWNFL